MLRQLLQKKSIQNGMWLYTLQIFNSILPLFTLPYIARILTPDTYGVFSLALNYVGYIVIVVEYGFNMTGARKVAIAKNSEDESRIFTETLIIRGALCLVCCVGVLLYCAIDNFGSLSQCMLALMIMSLGTVLSQTWFFQGKQTMKFIAIINIVSRSLSTVLIFLCVNDGGDLIIYCLLHASVTLINGLIETYTVCKKFGIRLYRLTLEHLREAIEEGWHLFISSFSSKVLGTLGITFLGWFATSYDCGVYAALYKIPSILMMVWSPISQVLYPMTSAKMGESYEAGSAFVQKMQRFIMPFFVIVCTLLCLFSKLVVGLLLGDSYVEHHYIVYPLLGWLLVGIYNNFLGVQQLLAAGYVKEYGNCIFWSAIIAALGNLIGIYFCGIYGAAYVPLISELVLTVLLKYKKMGISKTITQRKEE